MLIPLLLATVAILVLRGEQLATALAILPTRVGALAVAAFAIGVAMVGF